MRMLLGLVLGTASLVVLARVWTQFRIERSDRDKLNREIDDWVTRLKQKVQDDKAREKKLTDWIESTNFKSAVELIERETEEELRARLSQYRQEEE